jgi:Lrp/AsnC family transcriptional regulator, leucine-responsive regulatory protein
VCWHQHGGGESISATLIVPLRVRNWLPKTLTLIKYAAFSAAQLTVNEMNSLDSIDLRILAELQKDGALTNVELAKRVNLSPSPCLARVKSLEASGVIDRYVAIANAQKIGLGLNVFISISLKEQSKHALAAFEERIAEHDQVMECYLMTGDSDYLIRVVIADIQALEKFILEQLTPIPGIEKIRTSFTLKQVRYKTALPLGSLR